MGSAETNTGISETADFFIERKAKIGIINSKSEILTLKRNAREDTRQGELDWPGGKFDEDETDPLDVLYREVHEELPLARLRNVRLLCVIFKRTRTGMKETWMYAGNADFHGGKVITGDEHEDESYWYSMGEYSELANLPSKYRNAPALAILEDKFRLLAKLASPQIDPTNSFDQRLAS